MDNNIEQIKNIPILELADKLGIVVKNKFALCFKGHDRTPSLHFSPDKNLWNCFGCNIGGTNIELVEQYYNIGFKDTLDWFRRHYGFNCCRTEVKNRYNPPSNYSFRAKEKKDIASKVRCDIYEYLISICNLSNKGMQYLVSRGFTKDIINYFRLKDITDPQELLKLLKYKYSEDELMECGLVVLRSNKKQLLWWDHTIIIPFIINKRIEYLQGRRLSDLFPKYLNIVGIEKPFFNGDVLNNLKKGSLLCLCEGVFDSIAAHQIGITAIGVLGAASFREKWITMLQHYRIVIIPDADNGGKIFESDIVKLFAAIGKQVLTCPPKTSPLIDTSV